MEFPTTQWSMLTEAAASGDPVGRAAFTVFFVRYRDPVRAFIRRRGASDVEADDLSQEFFIHIMEKTTLRRADAQRGRFRSFLLGALVRFLARDREKRTAQKRGGGTQSVDLHSLEGFPDEPSMPADDERAYDRDWAVHLLRQALTTLETEYGKRGRTLDFEILSTYLPGSGKVPAPYEISAGQLGLGLAAFKTDVYRLRERLRIILRREIAATVASPEQIEEEVAYLSRVLQAHSG